MRTQSSTGESVRIPRARTLPIRNVTAKPTVHSSERHIGNLSRLLLHALNELRAKHELRREPTHGIYVTKHELRTYHRRPFLIRKIYITPSTIMYEGPYSEERCAVTRKYAEQSDRFLRVTFRDEGEIEERDFDSHLFSLMPCRFSCAVQSQ